MGLAIEVGGLAGLAELDSEGAEYLRASFERVNTLLVQKWVARGCLSRKSCQTSTIAAPLTAIHILSSTICDGPSLIGCKTPVVAAASLPEGDDPGDDPVVEQITSRQTSHLLCHSDAEGFYLPIDFGPLIYS